MTHSLSVELIESSLAQHNKPFVHVYIGYSGGVDSHVLLHLCANTPSLYGKVTAVYIHHGLQNEADAWAEHCKNTARNLDIDFMLLHVDASAKTGESPEEAAREARYAAFKTLLTADDALLIGQHRDDQLETVLLQLFRGAGLRGLSGIPESITLGLGTVLRPLLTVGKNEIDQYAQDQQLHWVEDPSNQKNEYDRNFLRNQVIPLIRQRWESCDKTVSRSARHCSEAQIIVSAVAEELFYPVFNRATRTLSIAQLLVHKSTRQQLIIRHWFHKLGLKMPSLCFLERVQHEVITAKEDSDPILEGQGYVIRRYRDNLYCLKQSNQEPPQDTEWLHDESSIALTSHHTLSYQMSSAGILQEQWQKAKVTIKFRSGGEKIRLPKRKENHTLKKLFQEAGIPPWERDLIPLIYMNGKLAAVGDLWISADFYHEKTDACLCFHIQ